MITIEATVKSHNVPSWAIWERKLIEVMEQSIYPFLDKYTRQDGTLIWGTEMISRDGADDFYESFYNWPLFYLLGGDDQLLTLGMKQWEAVTKQLTELGMLHNEYEKGYDWFHQGESYLYFYFLCMADPSNFKNIDRAQRFAGLYMNENPEAQNYDQELKIIRAPHNGSLGPRWGLDDGKAIYAWSPVMRQYGLPFDDIPGITTYDDLKDPALARSMGEAMKERSGRGDVATNLLATSLVTNAYLLTGEQKYKTWVLEYVDAWRERALENGGLLPDNVGLSGEVGEYQNGKWYGGNYGWTWPHGFYNIVQAAIVAGANAYILSQNPDYLDLARTQIALINKKGEIKDLQQLEMSLGSHFAGILESLDEPKETFVVPYRYGDKGWFDYHPMMLMFPTALWNLSMDQTDWNNIEEIRNGSRYDWNKVCSFRTKEDSGHEEPWLRFLAGENPTYPEQILRVNYDQVCKRLDDIREDTEDLTNVSIHHWQNLNPVLTEGLIQLTLGAPQVMYNGGLLICSVRYFDFDQRRPGLPRDVAALVEQLEHDRTVLRLVNISPFHTRSLIVQSGAFAEHRFKSVSYTISTIDSQKNTQGNMTDDSAITNTRAAIEDTALHVSMPPASEIVLDLSMERYVNQPTSKFPWNLETADVE